jgi:hypothetical protein
VEAVKGDYVPVRGGDGGKVGEDIGFGEEDGFGGSVQGRFDGEVGGWGSGGVGGGWR